jgi:teichuronic acid biosynthesis glycosyltransferase TuaG
MDEQQTSLISIIMPAYNAEKYIQTAIESVLEQQTDYPLELIVIDDASVDRTEEIVGEYIQKLQHWVEKQEAIANKLVRKIVYLKNETNLGVAESRNKGIRKASGEYIAFLDADDWWMPEKIEKQMELLSKTNAVLCATERELMNADGTSTGRIIHIPEEITYQMLLRTNSIPCSSVLLKRELALEFPMSHDHLHEDYILWLQVLKKYGKAYGISLPLLKCRLSENGKSRNKIKSAKMHFGVYRYLGFGFVKSLYYFVQYAVCGVLKYMG